MGIHDTCYVYRTTDATRCYCLKSRRPNPHEVMWIRYRMRLAGRRTARGGGNREQADWDAQVAGGDDATGTDLWGSMPTVDSKTVARMAPIFEKHEGCPLSMSGVIRPGGYASIDDVIQHLVYRK